jgi:hypothetical protein
MQLLDRHHHQPVSVQLLPADTENIIPQGLLDEDGYGPQLGHLL